MNQDEAIYGALLGGAVGDALGLPYEGLPPARAARMLGSPDRYRFFFGWGMVSDDTEHAALVAEALARSAGEVQAFEQALVQGLRGWILSLPAGLGWATLRAGLKLVLGVPPYRRGVFSAGNGPAMRAAVIGATVSRQEQILPLIQVSTRLTHTDPKAEYAALAVALATYLHKTAPLDGVVFLKQLQSLLPHHPAATELLTVLAGAHQHALRGGSTFAYAAELGLHSGVSGYAYHTVPAALHSCFQHPRDLMTAVMEVIVCGGDTDTAGAIVGGILGAGTPLPEGWAQRLMEPDLNPAGLRTRARRAGLAVATGQADQQRFGRPEGRVPRNLLFLGIVLVHGFRRLFPPY
ncbi:ADP-ribosylglycohydrolase family protein [Deinococcus aquatilis]|uniref:ADP-ribosylglycohydrolase family protein n=1 Tax=Deinococcus aquatilis TaxID=519440 RepID=UPI0003767679|nr:ADP-ribosylglycohydrolase family protein [Deinococcus aquatilis]